MSVCCISGAARLCWGSVPRGSVASCGSLTLRTESNTTGDPDLQPGAESRLLCLLLPLCLIRWPGLWDLGHPCLRAAPHSWAVNHSEWCCRNLVPAGLCSCPVPSENAHEPCVLCTTDTPAVAVLLHKNLGQQPRRCPDHISDPGIESVPEVSRLVGFVPEHLLPVI